MVDKALWIDTNVKEIKKRTVDYKDVNYGKIIVLQNRKNGKEINLLYQNYDLCVVIARNLIDYRRLTKVKSIDMKILMVLDAVRTFDFLFYFDKDVTKLILNE